MSGIPSERTAVVLDEHPLWLEAIEPVLRRTGVELVGKTTSAEDALALVESQRPDILIVSYELSGDPDAISTIRTALERMPGLKAIVLSLYDDVERVEAAFAAGAVAYVLKSSQPDDLALAIRQAFRHSIYLAGTPQPQPQPEVKTPADGDPGLTRRELEILQMVAEGYSNAQLARMLWVTEQTVKFHLSNIYRKLDVSNRTEASRWAQLHNLLPSRALAA
jgi:DNA-binding NarL/FixJ family response regulator